MAFYFLLFYQHILQIFWKVQNKNSQKIKELWLFFKSDQDYDDDLCFWSERKSERVEIVSLSSVAVLWLLTKESERN